MSGAHRRGGSRNGQRREVPGSALEDGGGECPGDRFDPGRTVVITGGAGFLGARVAELLLARQPQLRIRLTDIAESPRLDALRSRVEFVVADLADPAQASRVIDRETGTVFHLASLVSGGAERDFEAGLRANVHATLNVFEACRLGADVPAVVFTSSIATFGGDDLPDEIDDSTFQHPQNSYGVAKVIGEQLLNDYSRKGYLSGRGVRLPAIVVRDVANTAASGYASTMIREAIAGRNCECPVSASTRIPVMGAETATALLVRLAGLEEGALGDYRTVNGHGISPTAAEIAAAVGRVAGSHHARGRSAGSTGDAGQAQARPAISPGAPSVGAIRFTSEPAVERIVAAWPRVMRAGRADALGLPADESIDTIVESYRASVRADA